MPAFTQLVERGGSASVAVERVDHEHVDARRGHGEHGPRRRRRKQDPLDPAAEPDRPGVGGPPISSTSRSQRPATANPVLSPVERVALNLEHGPASVVETVGRGGARKLELGCRAEEPVPTSAKCSAAASLRCSPSVAPATTSAASRGASSRGCATGFASAREFRRRRAWAWRRSSAEGPAMTGPARGRPIELRRNRVRATRDRGEGPRRAITSTSTSGSSPPSGLHTQLASAAGSALLRAARRVGATYQHLPRCDRPVVLHERPHHAAPCPRGGPRATYGRPCRESRTSPWRPRRCSSRRGGRSRRARTSV